ncbi:MAG: Gfo/Idh/MocA family protein [Candidatus Methylacidiphilales bacterium]
MSSQKRVKEVRMGIIGLGNMGYTHARMILDSKVPRCRLTAICDINPDKLARFDQEKQSDKNEGGVHHFQDAAKMMDSGMVDAVLVATPHYDHTTLGIMALKKGLHLLVEKPISVHKSDAEKLIRAHQKKGQVFAAMFNQRTDPFYIKIKNLIQSGELGEIRRINWIITDWFRSEAYYASGGWRATWAGEGGGVLLNQCPHNIDLFQWMFGMPARVRAFCSLGKYHQIEVEDDVTAYFEYQSGATGVFITSTGETPGTNRLEITAERGRLVYEKDNLSFIRNEIPTSTFSATTKESFGRPPVWNVQIPVSGHGDQHLGILKNFTAAVLDKAPLIAPAKEGIHSVELANAMLYSSLKQKTVDLPLDGKAYEKELQSLIRNSKFKKTVRSDVKADMSSSF